jgi:cell division septation protein DedD
MASDCRKAVIAALVVTLGCACLPGAFGLPVHAQQPEQGSPQGKAGKKRQDPAEAERTVEAALRQLQAGKAEPAIQAMNAVLQGGNLPPGIMAKALYVRGVAQRRQGRPAQAISDLTSALWLRGGLGGDEREDAERERVAAYADAGLSNPGEVAAVRRPPKTEGSGNWLSGLFGFSSAPAPAPSPPPPPKVAVPVEEPQPQPTPAKAAVLDGWSSTTEPKAPPPQPERQPAFAAAPAAPPRRAPVPPAKAATGRYLIQLGAVRTEAQALALAAKVKREHAALLASRGQSVDRQVFGNMGAFYRVRFGPFASAQETQTACARLQGSGVDCMPLSQ